MKILVTIPDGAVKDSFLNEETKDFLQKNFEVIYNPMERNYTPEELAEAATDCDAVVTGWGTPHLGKAGLLCQGSKLKLVAHTGGSVGDLVDQTAFENGITVVSGNELYAESTAEGALAYMLSALRHIPDDVINMKT
ncbi:MAG: hydroxyacid dehydrogenase, partial [Firmicutes bacterium]|nr:hydroxyacid dehydrogenase [Bacillota bacterium]